MTPSAYLLLADALLVLHALIVFFNIFTVPLVWLGHFRKWSFVRNFYFRLVHLGLIGFVTAEALLGAVCPLTNWEDELRVRAGVNPRYAGGWLAHWLHGLIFYDVSPAIFAAAYLCFLLLVIFTLVRVKPRPPAWWKGGCSHRPA